MGTKKWSQKNIKIITKRHKNMVIERYKMNAKGQKN